MSENLSNTNRRSFIAKALMGTASIGLLSTTKSIASTFLLPQEAVPKLFTPVEGVNNPMGVAGGVVPGRVAWAHDPLACTWNGINGFWWEDAHNNQARIVKMFSNTLKSVANDSVATDFLTAEFDARTDIPSGVNTGFKVDMRNCDGMLHEAALANNPPSGSLYAPNCDGKRLPSLGIHEHWNNSFEKRYTRNLGIGIGIELVLIT
jgi:hypothetical protein